MQAKELLKQIIEETLARKEGDYSIDQRNEHLVLINSIPDNYTSLVEEKFIEVRAQYEKSHDSRLWTLLDLFASYLSGVEAHTGYIMELAKEALKSDASFFKDKEYWGEFLIEFEEIYPLKVFLENNPDYTNHYFIEKILREFAFSEHEIGDLILKYLNHHSSFVRDAAFQYLEEKALQKYNAKMVKALEIDHHNEFVVRHAIMALKNTGELELYKNEIKKVIDRLIEKGWADKDFFDDVLES